MVFSHAFCEHFGEVLAGIFACIIASIFTGIHVVIYQAFMWSFYRHLCGNFGKHSCGHFTGILQAFCEHSCVIFTIMLWVHLLVFYGGYPVIFAGIFQQSLVV